MVPVTKTFLLLVLIISVFITKNARSELSLTVSEQDGPFCNGCPMECFVWCVRVLPNVTSPCELARHQASKDVQQQCNAMKCVDFYCGTPSAIFCTPQGAVERNCLPPDSPFKDVPSTSKCWQWFERHCKGSNLEIGSLAMLDGETTATSVEPATYPSVEPIRTRPPMPPQANCPRCPEECGRLCSLAMSIAAPCSLITSDDDGSANNDSRKCSLERCHDSYCFTPHAYFCDENEQIDMSCSTDLTTTLFLNSTNEICQKWYKSLCNPRLRPLTPGVPKTRPTLPPFTGVTAGEVKPEPMLIVETARPINQLVQEKCEPSCPESCGDLCKAVRSNVVPAATAPCIALKTANPTCSGLRCRNFYCTHPLAVLCSDDNQIEWNCTSKSESALLFLNSTGFECQQWLMSLCTVFKQISTPPTTLPASRPPRPPPRGTTCPGCPEECGQQLCRMTNAPVAPCFLGARPNDTNCPAQRCRNSYCSVPHAYFCTENGQIDLNCTAGAGTPVSFLNSPSEVCRNWYLSQCNISSQSLTPGVTKVLPLTTPARVTSTPAHEITEPPAVLQPRPLTSADLCEPRCPEDCGDLCSAMGNPDIAMNSSPCMAVKAAEPSCVDTPCQNFYCKHSLAIFCAKDNQIEWTCTAKGEGAMIFLNSTGPQCQQWLMSLCVPRRVKVTAPPLDLRPETKAPAPTDSPLSRVPDQPRFEPCTRDCPPQCGNLCNTVRSLAAPCSVINERGGACPRRRCLNFYCQSPFGLFCTADSQQMDLECTSDRGAFAFLNSTIEECRNWIADQCKPKGAKIMPPEQIVMMKSRVKRELGNIL